MDVSSEFDFVETGGFSEVTPRIFEACSSSSCVFSVTSVHYCYLLQCNAALSSFSEDNMSLLCNKFDIVDGLRTGNAKATDSI